MEMSPEQAKELREKIKNMSPEELKEFQKQQCIFCQIISGKIPSKVIYEDKKVTAVLDINPAATGHILIMPKEHYAIMPQIPDDELGHLFMVSKGISHAMLRALKVHGTNIFVANGVSAGQKAQHFMAHIIPRSENDGVKGLDVPEQAIDDKTLDMLKKKLMPQIKKIVGGKDIKVPEVVEAEFKEAKEEKPKKTAKKKTEKKKSPKKKKGSKEESTDLDSITDFLAGGR